MRPSSEAENRKLVLNSTVQGFRRHTGFCGVRELYNEHYISFGYSNLPKTTSLSNLLDLYPWNEHVNELLSLAQQDSADVESKHQLALVFEHLGRTELARSWRDTISKVKPDWFQNSISIGRLRELDEPASILRRYYAEICDSPASYCLALARYVALRDAEILAGMTLDDLQLRIDVAGDSPVDEITKKIATGFVRIAGSDISGAKNQFSAGCLLLKSTRIDTTEIDEWSLAYARAFLLDQAPKSQTWVPSFATIPEEELSAACITHCLPEGSIRSVLSAFETVVKRAQPKAPKLNFTVYKGYRICRVENRFFAIPAREGDFFFFKGNFYHFTPDFGDQIVQRRDTLISLTNRRIRKAGRYIFYGSKIAILKVLNLIPGSTHIVAAIVRYIIKLYLRQFEIKGVLSDVDFGEMHRSIDRTRF